MLKFFSLLLFLLFSCFFISYGDEFHYKNIPIGGRGGYMGGAYTAVSDDPSGCFYNPAGIVYKVGRSLSLSGNIYTISEKRYIGPLKGIDGSRYDWVLESSKLSPSFFGIVDEIGNLKVCFSYAVPDYIFRDQHQIFYNVRSIFPDNPISVYIIDIYDVDNTYLVGPSVAYEISERFSVGLTLYLHYRSVDILRNHLLIFSKGESVQANYRESLEEYGIKPIIGFMLTPFEKFSVGLKASKNFIFYSDKFIQGMMSPIGLTGGLSYDYISDRKPRKTPYEYTVGFAWFPSSSFLLAVDIDYFPRPSSEYVDVYNFSAGSEIYIRDDIALRLGAYTDFSNVPPLKENEVNQREKLDIYGLSASISYFTFSSEITVGVGYQFGTGKAQVIAGSPEIQDISYKNIILSLSTVYNY